MPVLCRSSSITEADETQNLFLVVALWVGLCLLGAVDCTFGMGREGHL